MLKNLKKIKLLLPIILILVAVFGVVNYSLAQVSLDSSLGATFGLGTQELKGTIIKVINIFLGFLGILAVSILMYGGFLWMTSRGAVDKIDKAKKLLISAVIGLAIILLAFAIVQFIVSTFAGPVTPPTPTCDAGTVGICSGCNRCVDLGGPGPYNWTFDTTCDISCSGLPIPFEVTNIIPGDDTCPVIDVEYPRNSVIRIYFTKDVLNTPANIAAGIQLQYTGASSRCVGGALNVLPYDYVVGDRRIDIIPLTGTCPANVCGADRCFETNTTVDLQVAVGTLLAADGVTVLADNISFNEHPQFFTGSAIDCEKPSVSLVTTPQLCLGHPNDLNISATDDSGVAQVSFSDNNSIAPNAGFTSAPSPFDVSCAVPPCGNPTPWTLTPGTVLWTPTSPDYVAGTNYRITVEASDLDSNTDSASKNFILRENHCCSGTQDADEEGIDCGGADCGSCAGAACGDDMNSSCSTSSCVPNNGLCASNICGCVPAVGSNCTDAGYDASVAGCCLCQNPPLIDCVTPNDTDSCVAGHVPLGTVGTLVSIWGRDFGSYVPGLSTVTINGVIADLASTVNFACTESWTDTQIVVVVPPFVGVSGEIVVTNAGGYSDSTADTQGLAIGNFLNDGVNRPSLCSVENNTVGSACFGNNCGHFGENINASGVGISLGDEIEFGFGTDVIPATLSTPAPTLFIGAQIPSIAPSNTTLRATTGTVNSNNLNFKITQIPGGPIIDYLDPNFGPAGQYITIYGSGFGSSPAGSSVTFGGVAGNFTFPTDCKVGDYWRNNYIIVKVPTGLTLGLNDVVVTVGGTASNSAPFNYCTGASCPLLPGMCRISPIKGPINTQLDVWGDNFGGAFGTVEFYDSILASSIFGWSNKFIDNANVTTGAVPGPVIVTDSAGHDSSNSIPFEVGSCTTSADCPLPTDSCCAGACYATGCPVPNFSTYTWTFTTGEYFIKEECSGTGLPSPSPSANRSGGQDVCINAAVSATFKEPVVATSVNSATVLVQECVGPVGNECSILGPNITGAGSFVPIPSVPGPGIDGFRFDPSAVLAQDSWYQVSLLGGTGNITAVSGSVPLIDDYIWTFKTRNNTDQCAIGKVSVDPNNAKLIDINATQDFVATPINKDDQCIVLNGSLYSYLWGSSDTTVATVSGSTITTETATPNLNGTTEISATALPDGITGKAILDVDYEGLVINSHWYECEKVCVNAELGLRFDKQVNSDTLTTGPGDNINIYECLDGVSCNNYLSTLVPILPHPTTNYIWDVVSGESLSSITTAANMDFNTYHRVVVKGGANGVKAKLGDPLMSLNANLAYGEECDSVANCSATCLWTGSACGTDHQECINDGNIDNLDGCSATCFNSGPVTTTCGNSIINSRENCDYNGMCVDGSGIVIGDGTVGNPHVFCNNDTICGAGNTCSLVETNGCSDTCLLSGSTHTAVCGDGKIEWGEACDDNNQTNGDGCSNVCLREGRKSESNPTYPFVVGSCGDGGVDVVANGAGEDCDDNNNISGDGCSADCLSEGVKGSICGDGVVGVGEDCDSELGCNGTTCLWNGSAGEAVCGNGIIENKTNDAFSWVFKTKDVTDDSCANATVEIVPGVTNIFINEIKDFKITVRSNADECDARGQSINPKGFTWNWWSDSPVTADIFTTCGNGEIDLGEDCDNGGRCDDGSACETGGSLCADNSVCEIAIINNCSLNCLNDGGSASCGNTVVDPGEDCDSTFGCDATCLHNGSSLSCGNGVVEIGEDCDDNNTITNDGCSSDCLNEGPVLNKPYQKVIGISVLPTPTVNINAADLFGMSGVSAVTVVEPVGPVPCQLDDCPGCNTGVTSCGSIYTCIEDPAPAPPMNFCASKGADIQGCFCCCNPLAAVDTCPGSLTCTPNIGNCTDSINPPPLATRGQCCGASSNLDCVAAFGLTSPYVGDDTCCHGAPTIVSTDPADLAVDVCRNALISAEFNTEMDSNTFARNFEVARQYSLSEFSVCPAGEKTSAFRTSGGGFIYCAIDGSIDSRDVTIAPNVVHTVLEFAPKKVMSANTQYFVTAYGTNATNATCGNGGKDLGEDCDDRNNINGDGCSRTCLLEGAKSVCGASTDASCCGNGRVDVGEECDDGKPTCNTTTCLNTGTASPTCGNGDIDLGEDCDDRNNTIGDGCSSNCRNEGTVLDGIQDIFGIPLKTINQWSFITQADICKISDIQITSIVGNGDYGRQNYTDVKSDLFICSGLDDGDGSVLPDTYCYRDAMRPSTVSLVPDNPNFPGNQHIYQARPVDQFKRKLNFTLYDWLWTEHDASDIFDLHSIADVSTVDLTEINIAARSHNVSGNGFLNISATSKGSVDSSIYGNFTKRFDIKVFLCKNPWPSVNWWPWEDDSIKNETAICDSPPCTDTFFELFYCRDFGDPGPEDDLPALASDPIIFGSSGDILKEFLFIEDESGSGGPLILDSSATPCKGPSGTPFDIEARVIDINGVASVTVSIQDPDETEIVSIPLLDSWDGTTGNRIYGTTWTSTCGASECSYFVDITAVDGEGNTRELENISCVNP